MLCLLWKFLTFYAQSFWWNSILLNHIFCCGRHWFFVVVLFCWWMLDSLKRVENENNRRWTFRQFGNKLSFFVSRGFYSTIFHILHEYLSNFEIIFMLYICMEKYRWYKLVMWQHLHLNVGKWRRRCGATTTTSNNLSDQVLLVL